MPKILMYLGIGLIALKIVLRAHGILFLWDNGAETLLSMELRDAGMSYDDAHAIDITSSSFANSVGAILFFTGLLLYLVNRTKTES